MAAPVPMEPADFVTAIVEQQRLLPVRRAPGSKRMAAVHHDHEEYAGGVSFRGESGHDAD